MRQVLKTQRQLWIRKNRSLLPETFLENMTQKIKHYTSLKPQTLSQNKEKAIN